MKLCTFNAGQDDRVGLTIDGETIVDVNLAYAGILNAAGEPKASPLADVVAPPEIIELIKGGASTEVALGEVAKAAAKGGLTGPNGEQAMFKADDVHIKAPVPAPSKIFAIAINNKQKFHIAEKPDCEEHPNYFIKVPTCLTGPYDPIEIPDIGIVGSEIEVAAVISKTARFVKPEDAMDHIYGFMTHNDITAHELRDTSEWIVSKRPEGDVRLTYSGRYKCFDTFSPMGPWLVTKDEIKDINNLSMVARHNGKDVQVGSTDDMVFGWDYLIPYLSAAHTLYPGDIVSWGTVISPEGVNFQKIDLRGEGGYLESEVEQLGTLNNPIKPI